MKKLIIILIALSLSSCAALRAQQEFEEEIAKKEKYEFTKETCSAHNDYIDTCFTKHNKSKLCDDAKYIYQGKQAEFKRNYGEFLNTKVCKQFVMKKTVKKGKKKVNKKK